MEDILLLHLLVTSANIVHNLRPAMHHRDKHIPGLERLHECLLTNCLVMQTNTWSIRGPGAGRGVFCNVKKPIPSIFTLNPKHPQTAGDDGSGISSS